MKNNIHLVSFATTIEDIGFPDLELRQIRLNESALKNGIKNIHTWNRQKLLKTGFYKENKKILDYKKGAGFWLWKPYIIYDTLLKMKEGEYLFYADNSLYFIDKIDDLLPICDASKGVMLFVMDEIPYNSIKCYTKKRLFELTNTDLPVYLEASTVKANCYLFKKNDFSIQFIKEYLDLCSDERILIDEDLLNLPPCKEYSEYINSHNHDQSVISILRIKHNLPGYRVLFQHGNHSKIKEYRVEGEWMLNKEYCNIFNNSPYYQKMIWDKDGFGCKRPMSHYLNPFFVLAKVKRTLNG